MKKGIIITLVVLALLVVYGISTSNSLVRANEDVDAGWAAVETQYQRRFDLIPQLVETVKGVAKQEVAVFTAIADARAHYAGATNVNEKVAAANEVESALARLLVITENYPQLKSQENFLTLQAQIEGTENRISVERGRFNELVRDYNTRVKTFPTMIIAKIAGYGERTYFESDNAAATAPKVQF